MGVFCAINLRLGGENRTDADRIVNEFEQVGMVGGVMLFDQSYALVKPLVDDACKHPESVGQNELEHLFDATLDIMTAKGDRLFRRLCKAFAPYYPDSVSDYIRIKREIG